MRISILLLILTTVLNSLWAKDNSCFIAKEKNHIKAENGQCEKRHSPCSTFKIPLSLMGYNEGILINTTHPKWPYKPGYPDWVGTWKQAQTPSTWIQNSCVWYSQIITQKMGMRKFKKYIALFNYGNQDVSGDKAKHNGLTNSWLSSSLQISPVEQVDFLEKLLHSRVPINKNAIKQTQAILYIETLPGGWRLYGKTGSGSELKQGGTHNNARKIGWFIGWVEKFDRKIVFAEYIEDDKKIKTPAGIRAKKIAKEKILTLLLG